MINAQIIRRLDCLSAAVTVVELKLASEVEWQQLSEAMGSRSDRNAELREFLLRHATIIRNRSATCMAQMDSTGSPARRMAAWSRSAALSCKSGDSVCNGVIVLYW